MASPVLTKSLTQLRTDFNQAFSGRDKASDGWIGDTAHQQETSGHNPDDTPGVSAEYSDSDSKQEVRAIDIDKDLRDSTETMFTVIESILNNPKDTRRLAYIIYNGVIWSASHNWAPHDYTGSNPHDQHAHFSGDPDYDEDATTWSIGDAMTDAQAYVQHVMNHRLDGLVHFRDPITVPEFTAPGGTKYNGFTESCQFTQAVKAVQTGISDIKTLIQAEDGSGGGIITPGDNTEVLNAITVLQTTVDGLVNGVKANASAVSS